jgi:hypothetical protein
MTEGRQAGCRTVVDVVHEGGGRNTGRLGGGQRAEQHKVSDQHVRRRAPQFGQGTLGPGGCPGKWEDVDRDRGELLGCPAAREPTQRRGLVQRVRCRILEGHKGCAGRHDALPEAGAHWQPAGAHARAGQDADLVTARDEAGGNRQDEGDVPTALEHREEEPRRAVPAGRDLSHPARLPHYHLPSVATIVAPYPRRFNRLSAPPMSHPGVGRASVLLPRRLHVSGSHHTARRATRARMYGRSGQHPRWLCLPSPAASLVRPSTPVAP